VNLGRGERGRKKEGERSIFYRIIRYYLKRKGEEEGQGPLSNPSNWGREEERKFCPTKNETPFPHCHPSGKGRRGKENRDETM